MIFNQTVAVTTIASLQVINHHLILSFYIEPFIFVLRIPPLLFVVKKIKISDWISGVFGYFLFPFVFKQYSGISFSLLFLNWGFSNIFQLDMTVFFLENKHAFTNMFDKNYYVDNPQICIKTCGYLPMITKLCLFILASSAKVRFQHYCIWCI